MKRKRITREALHELLQREYAETAGDLCLACRLPMPNYFGGAGPGPNWRLPLMPECAGLCHTIAADVAAKVGQRYELEMGSPPSRG